MVSIKEDPVYSLLVELLSLDLNKYRIGELVQSGSPFECWLACVRTVLLNSCHTVELSRLQTQDQPIMGWGEGGDQAGTQLPSSDQGKCEKSGLWNTTQQSARYRIHTAISLLCGAVMEGLDFIICNERIV